MVLNEIISNGISGVYKHPFIEGEIVSFIFDNDQRDNPYQEVGKQLMDLGVDTEGLGPEYRDLEKWKIVGEVFLNRESHSSHSQFKHDHYDDTNLSKIYTGKNPDDEHNKISLLTTMFHEAAHSLAHQQISTLDIMLINHGAFLRAENSAYVAGNLKAFQFVHEVDRIEQEKGIEGLEMSKVDLFMENFNAEGMMAHQILVSKGSLDAHLYDQSYMVLNEMYENHPEVVLALSDSDIVELADLISQESLDFDFTPVYKEKLMSTGGDLYKLMENLDKMGRLEPEKLKAYSDKLNSFYDDLDLDNIHSTKDQNVVLMKEALDYYVDGALKMNSDEFKEYYSNNKIEDVLDGDPLKLTNLDSNHLIGALSMDAFKDKIKESSVYKDVVGEKIIALEKKNACENNDDEVLKELKEACSVEDGNTKVAQSKTKTNKRTL